MQKIVTNLWFDTEAEEAAKFYISILGGKITDVSHYGEAGPREAGMVLTVSFELGDGQIFTAINGGPEFPFTEAISLLVNCDSQEEIDTLWAKFTDGGEEVQCGWLKDRYGLSWQIVPRAIIGLLQGENPEGANRAMKAMLGMKKIDIAAMQAAYDG
ncbi:MAG: hypothetical protein QOG04_1943 [Actinomycetota bacterium]|jgi:predicted 3-demethylubiquinone-9 3-methyltransferase (glyoxalase superfamily)|nr:hypothetical protein [Actinomycetota bacterium]